MDTQLLTRKDIGALGERVVCEYLRRKGFIIVDRNVSRKTGELDIIASKDCVFHFVEVKSTLCNDFPNGDVKDGYSPAFNLHGGKIRKVVRTAEWYRADSNSSMEWQVDGAMVWIRRSDGMARVTYLAQIV